MRQPRRPQYPACNGNNGGNNGPGSCLQPFCGDGYTNDQFKPDGINPEQCDSGTAGDTSACNSSTAPVAFRCQPAICGDNYHNAAAEECDRGPSDTAVCNGNTAGAASCKPPICHDGHLNGLAGEQCEVDTDCPANQKCNSVCQCN